MKDIIETWYMILLYFQRVLFAAERI